MLALGREYGQRVRLTVAGHVIWVTLTRTRDGSPCLAFDAPRAVQIKREELLPMWEQYETVQEFKQYGLGQ